MCLKCFREEGVTFEEMYTQNDVVNLILYLPLCFQRLMVAQNRRIDQLVEKIKQQQDKLEKQSLQLEALQRKVSRTPSKCKMIPI